jgi:hypothetical protein
MHPTLQHTAVAAMLLAATCAAQAADPDINKRQADIDAIVREISPKRMHDYVEKLVSFGTRHTMSDTNSSVAAPGAWKSPSTATCTR